MWYWKLTNQRRRRHSFDPNTQRDFLAGWSRENGKSSTVEWACITEGAAELEGYVLYVSNTQASAENHVSAIRQRLESNDITQFFPDLAAPQIGNFGNQYGWRQNFLMTKSGWAIRPVGLDVAVRGFKEGDLRPSMIVFDDIDDYKMSLADAETNLGTISRSILPSGTKNTIHLIAQNLIAEHCVVNQIYTGQTDVLADHFASVYPAFDELEVEQQIDRKTGKSKSVIKHAVPVWSGFDTESAQIYLNKVGLEAFYAEYQHDFTLDQTDKVLPEYQNYPVHVIAWTQFKEKFGTIYRVPQHWQIGVGLDIGFTNEHISAWTWIAVAAEDSCLPFAHFRFRGKTFVGKSITDQADAVIELAKYINDKGEEVDEREQWTVMVMSHEKEGEQLILNRQYEMPFADCKFRREDGLPEWRALLRVDYKQPHPFHEDRLLTPEECKTKQLDVGSYLLGRPNYFEVVDDGQENFPKDDDGLATHRSQTANWKRKKVKLTVSGVQDAVPMKFKDDTCVPAGTLISTSTGLVPIEDIKEGNLVWTRLGYQKVLCSWLTGFSDELVRVETADGKTIEATPNHPLFANNQFVRIDSTCMDDILVVCKNEKSSSLAEKSFTGILSPLMQRISGITNHISAHGNEALKHCILKYGNLLMGMFRQGSRYITKTTTLLTTLSKIWSASAKLNTRNFIPILSETLYLPNSVEKYYVERSLKSQRGETHPKARSGTETTLPKALVKSNQYLKSAITVVTSILQSVETKLGSALIAASRNHYTTVTKVTHLTLSNAIPTYNLSVENCQEYFANGILVHNCDSTRMIFAEQKLSATGLTAEQERRVALKNKIRTGNLTLEAGQGDYNGILKARLMDLREIEMDTDTGLTEQEQLVRSLTISPPLPNIKRNRF